MKQLRRLWQAVRIRWALAALPRVYGAADKTVTVALPDGSVGVLKYRDMLDGTLALVVAAELQDTPTRAYQGQGAAGAAAALTATLAAVAAKTSKLAGFYVSGGGATAAGIITVTVTGLLIGTLTFKIAVPAGATLGIVPLSVIFNPPQPASAVNTAIVVNVPSFGAGNTDEAVNAWGYAE